MSELGIHIVPNGRGWAVRKSGSLRAWRVFASKGEAVRASFRLTPKALATLYMHDEGGRIVKRLCRPVWKRR